MSSDTVHGDISRIMTAEKKVHGLERVLSQRNAEIKALNEKLNKEPSCIVRQNEIQRILAKIKHEKTSRSKAIVEHSQVLSTSFETVILCQQDFVRCGKC